MSTRRLQRALEDRGHASRILAGEKEQSPSPSLSSIPDRTQEAVSRYCLRRGLLDYAVQGSHSIFTHPFFIEADIIHYQNLHRGFFNPWSLAPLSHIKPAVWTLRDMQALTGHCAHAFDCDSWAKDEGCHDCPRLDMYPPIRKDVTPRLWKDKKNLYARSRLWIVAPSTWMLGKVQKSILREHPSTVILNSVDVDTFSPHPKKAVRAEFGLPQDALLIGCSAVGGVSVNPFKGGAYVIEALKLLTERFASVYLVNIGGGADEKPLSPNTINIPFEKDQKRLARLYSSLDIFLNPTLADTCPLVAMEMLCCGIPVVGFATGGMTDIVRHGIDGLLVPTGDTKGLVAAAETLLGDEEKRINLGYTGFLDGQKRFDWRLMGERYEKLYYEVLQQAVAPAPYTMLSFSRVPSVIQTFAFLDLERAACRATPKKGISAAQKMVSLFPRLFLPIGHLLYEFLWAVAHLPRNISRRIRKRDSRLADGGEP